MFRFLFLEELVTLAAVFGRGVLPCGQFIHIHRCQDRDDTGILAVLGRGLHRNHAVSSSSRIEQLVIPHFIVPMQIDVAVLVRSTFLFHYQIKCEDAVRVVERTDSGDKGIFDTAVLVQYFQCPFGVYVRYDIIAFQPFFTVDNDSLHFLVLDDDAGCFAVVENRTAIGPDYINQFQTDLHASVYETVSAFNIGMVNHGMLIEGGNIFQAAIEQSGACQHILQGMVVGDVGNQSGSGSAEILHAFQRNDALFQMVYANQVSYRLKLLGIAFQVLFLVRERPVERLDKLRVSHCVIIRLPSVVNRIESFGVQPLHF